MIAALQLSSSASAYVKITPSGITANLVQYGTSMITRGYQQDLLLDPGTFSVDPDATIFNASVSFLVINKSYSVLLSNRIGTIIIIVEFMVFMIFQILADYY